MILNTTIKYAASNFKLSKCSYFWKTEASGLLNVCGATCVIKVVSNFFICCKFLFEYTYFRLSQNTMICHKAHLVLLKYVIPWHNQGMVSACPLSTGNGFAATWSSYLILPDKLEFHYYNLKCFKLSRDIRHQVKSSWPPWKLGTWISVLVTLFILYKHQYYCLVRRLQGKAVSSAAILEVNIYTACK